MPAYTHGGDVYGLDVPILDFSISLNFRGMPPCAIRAAQAALEAPPSYPDPHCRALRRVIAARDGVGLEQVLCGNGASDLIDRLVRAVGPRNALILSPTFSEYERSLQKNKCKVKVHYTKSRDDFRITEEILCDISQEMDILLLCDPNNPSGTLAHPALLDKILVRCRETGTLLAVDQCFLELTGAEPGRLTGQLGEGGLLLLRALTKSYGMAGLRLGYCLCGDRGLLKRMEEAGQPWPVSSVAQEAGISALQDAPRWPFQAQPELERERSYLKEALRRLGFRVYPSDANFLLFQGEAGWRERLLAHGILIRGCEDFRGLGSDYYRIGVRAHAENERLIRAIETEMR